MKAERNLRRTLTVNAVASGLVAVGGVAFAGPVGRLLDVSTAAVWIVAAALVPWSIGVLELARSERAMLLRATPWISVGDALWVAASAVLLAGGIIDRSGWWLVVPMAVAVGELGATQALLWRSLTRQPAVPAPAVA